MPRKQSNPQILLELAELLADGGRRDAQLPGRHARSWHAGPRPRTRRRCVRVGAPSIPEQTRRSAAADYRRGRYAYLRGLARAALLTAVPFIREGTRGDSRTTLLWVIGAFGLAQILVHVRYFLHVDFSSERREELALLVFSAALLALMIAGMLWILYNRYVRMM